MTGADAPSRDPALELVWSLWTELGIPGPYRNHQRVILDPEWLLLFTPWIARDDPRLLDLVVSWCERHHAWIPASRLSALSRKVPDDVRACADSFFAILSPEISWARTRSEAPRSYTLRFLRLPTERPALLRFRMRALAGVSGRADVLSALLAAPTTWIRAADIEGVGLAKRNVARILSELTEGGLTHAKRHGNTVEFRLAAPQLLGQLTGAPQDAFFPDWPFVFAWIKLGSDLLSLQRDRPATLRVEVAKRRPALTDLAITLGLEAPAAEDTDALFVWVEHQLRALADGISPAIGGT